jgi:VanZ family protein
MRRWPYFLPAFFEYALIFYLSSRSRFPVEAPFVGFDKIVHCLEFAGLGFLLAIGFLRSRRCRRFAAVLPIWAGGSFLGLLDEFHQLYVPARHFDFWDAATDFAGVAFGVLLYCRVRNMGQARRETRS